ncbi:MAG: hypothetical protein JSS83_27400 [Cyanobacteria bacterium SZAS LIN-3]|nr:hypothetical protein [Cyanobacteria bacterium SZAS LIN-3]
MTVITFAVILGGGLSIFSLFFLLDMRAKWKNEILQGVTGVKDWRVRLNTLTDRFVALGNEPLLKRAASNSDDPVLAKLQGQTRAFYVQLKERYLALSYAYNCGARAVQSAEASFKAPGALKLVSIRRSGKLSEKGLEIKEVSPDRYLRLLNPDRYSPKPPVYQLEYIFTVSGKLIDEITAGIKRIAEHTAGVASRLGAAEKAMEGASGLYSTLLENGATYLPYDRSKAAIEALGTRINDTVAGDPIGAYALCNDLDGAIKALVTELNQAKQQLASVKDGQEKLTATRQWVAKVRSTNVTCPWSDEVGESAYWTLSSVDSDPDALLLQAETLLAQASQSLANGQLQTVTGECKQAFAAREQAEKMVKALFDAKTAIDEEVPRVRAELAAIQSELVGITGGETTHEMAQLVKRTCAAVEGRINEVHTIYCKQSFPEAKNLLTGTAGNEYGMPVAKLLTQARELLTLLKKAAQVASTLTEQTA